MSDIESVEKTLQKTRGLALDLLAQREYSAHELRKKLLSKKCLPENVDKVLTDLQNEHLQSDQRFCEVFINSHANRGHGPVRLQEELKRHGIVNDLVQEVLESINIDWQQQIENVQRKKFKNRPKHYAEMIKQKRFLLYRGFTHEQIADFFKERND